MVGGNIVGQTRILTTAIALDGVELEYTVQGTGEPLVEQHHAMLVRLALRYVPDVATAEDVAQETWLHVLRGLARFEFPLEFEDMDCQPCRRGSCLPSLSPQAQYRPSHQPHPITRIQVKSCLTQH